MSRLLIQEALSIDQLPKCNGACVRESGDPYNPDSCPRHEGPYTFMDAAEAEVTRYRAVLKTLLEESA